MKVSFVLCVRIGPMMLVEEPITTLYLEMEWSFDTSGSGQG